MNYSSSKPSQAPRPAAAEAGKRERRPAAGLPCLNSNISIEVPSSESFKDLSTQQRKTAFILRESVSALADRYGVNHLGFLTLTFRDHVLDHKEASRRLNSLLSNVIKKRYREYVGVMERQRSRRIHYHLLIVLNQDIRSGVDFKSLARGNYSSASPGLRIEWRFWRETAPKYGFGRTELLPVKSNIEAMAKYVGKYIAKHVTERLPEDKGARLVRYSRGARVGTTRFQFNSQGASEWRRKVATFAEIVQTNNPHEVIADISDLSRFIGPRWAYHYGDFIRSLP